MNTQFSTQNMNRRSYLGHVLKIDLKVLRGCGLDWTVSE